MAEARERLALPFRPPPIADARDGRRDVGLGVIEGLEALWGSIASLGRRWRARKAHDSAAAEGAKNDDGAERAGRPPPEGEPDGVPRS